MKKILMVNEFSGLNTGYSVYGREILSRLHKTGKYEVAELACYIGEGDERMKGTPWKVFPNMPTRNKETDHLFNTNGTHAFGEYSFDRTCLLFKPDIVFDIRDFWMMEHQARSPFRPHFRWVIMPTVDGYPQQEQWIDAYASADAVLTYTNWSGEILRRQAGNTVNWLGAASPSATHEFMPLAERDKLREQFHMGQDVEIIGTVMRNQKRKLYPELFDTFKRYIDKTGKKNTILYCHISYPDNGWDVPQLIKEYGLSTRVFLTYICSNPKCGFAYPSTYQDVISFCPRCRSGLTHVCNVNHGVNNATLNQIYNTFDLYVQYANSEGFGMPQVEAAACGVPVAATDYSAMSEIVRNLQGYVIPVTSMTRELETGCDRARPDDNALLSIFEEFFSVPPILREVKRKEVRRAYEEHYGSWDKTTAQWEKAFDSMQPAVSWNAQPRIFSPAQPSNDVNSMNNLDYARWLITSVLCEPHRAGTYFESRIVRDLNYGVHCEGMGGLYYNEQAHMFDKPKFTPFNREVAYKNMVNLCNRRNQAESARMQSLNSNAIIS